MTKLLKLGGDWCEHTDLGLPGEGGSPHTHPISEVVDLQTTLDGKAASAHAHAIGDVTGLQTALDSKSDANHTHPGGGDLWTYVKLAADFTRNANTAVDVTGMSFVPSANSTYLIEGTFMMRTATTSAGPRPGVAWPTGCTDGAMRIEQASSAVANVISNGGINASLLVGAGGLPVTTQSYPAFIFGMFVTGANPGGSFRVQLASESTAVVTMKAGSWFRYRTI
jgi:hypothetical protein